MDKTRGPASWPWIAATALLLAGGAYAVVWSTGETPVTALRRPVHEILAIADFDRVLDLRPDDATTLRRRAKAHALLRDFPEAISDLKRTIELMPNATELPGESATVHAIRSQERFEQGDYEGSRADMDEGIRREPGNPEFHEKRGFAPQKLRRNDEAAAALKKAKELAK
jgi:Flp pilus assembly protein TadD